MSRGQALGFLAAGLWSCSPRSPGIAEPVVRIALSRSGTLLAAANRGGIVSVLDLHRGARREIRTGSGPVNDLKFSPDDRCLVIAARDLLLWNFNSEGPPRRLTSNGANYGVAVFLSTGASMVTITGSGVIQRMETATGRIEWSQCCTSIYGEAAAHGTRSLVVTAGHTPRLWEAATGRPLGAFIDRRSGPAFGPVAFEPNGKSVWIGCQDGVLRQWDAETRKMLRSLPAQPGWIESVAVSPSGGRVAFAVRDRGIHLWDGAVRVVGSVRPSSNILFTSDGRKLVVGSSDGGLLLVPIDVGAPETVIPQR